MNCRERHPQLEGKEHLRNLHSHSAHNHRLDFITDPLYVIAPVFNPQRFRSRWKHYLNFEKHILDSGAYLVTVEATFGERGEVVTEQVSERHKVITVSTNQEIWLKESMINLGIQNLPSDWKYVAWVDADVQFVRPDWVGETIHQLQHYDIVQMFSVALDLDPNFHPYCINYSFMYDYINGAPNKDMGIKGKYGHKVASQKHPTLKANHWHPGFAWAGRREALAKVGGLIDFAILGSADDHMAKALIGKHHASVPPQLKEYTKWIKNWEERAEKHIARNVGYVGGTINHFFHGAKKNRKYVERWQIFKENDFQPSLDIMKDLNGLWQLTGRNYKLRNDIRNYFRQRNEDSISMEGVEGFL